MTPGLAPFWERYRSAFERGDAGAIAEAYRYPAVLVTPASTVVWRSAAEATPALERLLASYASRGIDRIELVEVTTTVLGSLSQCDVVWQLRGAKPGRFATRYWLTAHPHPRITAVLVHDESPPSRP